MGKKKLSSFVRPAYYTCKVIEPADFLKQLIDLKIKEEFRYTTMLNYKGKIRGYFQFFTEDSAFPKLTVAVREELLPDLKGDTNLEKLKWCLHNSRLLEGRSTQGNDFLTFSASNVETGTLDFDELVKNFEH